MCRRHLDGKFLLDFFLLRGFHRRLEFRPMEIHCLQNIIWLFELFAGHLNVVAGDPVDFFFVVFVDSTLTFVFGIAIFDSLPAWL